MGTLPSSGDFLEEIFTTLSRAISGLIISSILYLIIFEPDQKTIYSIFSNLTTGSFSFLFYLITTIALYIAGNMANVIYSLFTTLLIILTGITLFLFSFLLKKIKLIKLSKIIKEILNFIPFPSTLSEHSIFLNPTYIKEVKTEFPKILGLNMSESDVIRLSKHICKANNLTKFNRNNHLFDLYKGIALGLIMLIYYFIHHSNYLVGLIALILLVSVMIKIWEMQERLDIAYLDQALLLLKGKIKS